jgi:hypothetical protein
MMNKARKQLLAGIVAGMLLIGSGNAALAASDQASCLGQSASAVPPGTKDDVAHLITDIAHASGTNHGGLVSTFAHQKTNCPFVP